MKVEPAHPDHVGFRELLEAAIDRIEDLRGRGVGFVSVQPDTWTALSQARPYEPGSPAPSSPPSAVPSSQPAASRPGSLPSLTPSPQSLPAVASQPRVGLDRPVRQTLSPGEQGAALAALRTRVLPCRKCEHLANSRQTVVFGVGSAHAELMFVGEAPGADEDAQGEPFVGRAGQLLTRMIAAMGLSRETVYIANILKCRPDTPGQASGNRKPTPSEMVTCLPYLIEQIEVIQPKVLVALGGTSVEGLLGKMEGITRLRGRWLEFRGTPLMPTYHPAYLLHNQALTEKRKVWEDMLEVMERLALPITEKQRQFFLRGG